MVARVLLGSLVTGVVVFVWGSISHMATPIGEMGIRQIPSEDKVVPAMKDAIHEPGFYFFPGMENMKSPSEADTKAWEAKLKQGPTGVLIIRPEGSEGISPKTLLTEFGSNIVAAFLAAVVLSQVRSSYLGRVLVVTLMGVFGFVSIVVSYWNWFGFPTDFVTGALLDEVIGWFLGGLALAAIVRPAQLNTEVPV